MKSEPIRNTNRNRNRIKVIQSFLQKLIYFCVDFTTTTTTTNNELVVLVVVLHQAFYLFYKWYDLLIKFSTVILLEIKIDKVEKPEFATKPYN